MRKKVLSIAGSDCSGGAGIQADLKTMTMHGLYGMSVITAITAQNTTGVKKSEKLSTSLVAAQIDAVCSDIMPDAVKTGMLHSSEIIDVVACKIKEYKLQNIVVDPVLISTSGSRLLESQSTSEIVKKLMPLATLITPNIPEIETFTGISIHNKNDMAFAASKLCKLSGTNVLVKGGHGINDADDLLYCTEKTAMFIKEYDCNKKDNNEISCKRDSDNMIWFCSKKIDTDNTHGTGCTLSSAIACNLASGFDIVTAILSAKNYLYRALNSGLNIGSGNGPIDHCLTI